MSHFDTIAVPPVGRHGHGLAPATRRLPPSRTATGASSACSSTPRWSTPRTARRCSSTSSTTPAGSAPTGRCARSSRPRSRPSGPRSGDGRVICGLSGGVDSAVAAALVHKAIGAQLTCVFVDTGLMRLGEGEQVVETFRRHQGIELIHVRAADRFFERLAGRHRPRGEAQDHRRAVHPGLRGRRGWAHRRRGSWCRAPSTPTSSSRARRTRPRSRATTTSAASPTTWTSSSSSRCGPCSRTRSARSAPSSACPTRSCGASPSPAPASGCASSARSRPTRSPSLQHADAIVREEIKAAGLEREIWQAFAVLPDIRSVGVMGDERTYDHPIIIRAVTSEDAMTADWARLPYELLETHVEPDHQRGRRRQPRRLRHHLQAAGHHRVGVSPT